MNGVILCGAALTFFTEELPKLAGNYLEIGVYDGRLISTLAERFPDRKCYGVDPFIEDGYTYYHNGGVRVGDHMPHQHKNAEENVSAFPNAKLFVMPSIEFNEKTTDAELDAMNISAILIDGNHHSPHVENDFLLASRLLKRGGVIYADDLGVEDVARACGDFIKREFLRIEQWHGSRFWIRPA